MNCKKCESYFPTKIKIKGKWKSLQRRKYCLDCSPWNTHNTRKLEINNSEIKFCPCCKTTKSVKEFYVRSNRTDPSPYCIECSRKERINRIKSIKIKSVEYKGGKCKCCGYNKCNSALEFHHRNRDEKEFSISQLTNLANWEIIKKELDKCVLVCCRCHREIEAGLIPCPE